MATVGQLVFQANTAQVKDAKRDLDNLSASARNTAKSVQQTGSNVVDASNKFRPMRGALTQASFQLQDVAVQAQAGTNAFVILGQQGPQIASIFGPSGAVAGALLAFGALVGGVLYKTLGGAEDEVDRLAAAMEGLEQAFERTEQGSFTLSQRLKELAQNSRELAEIELAIGIASAKIAFEEAQDAIVSSVSGITTAVNTGADAFREYGDQSDYARNEVEKYRKTGLRVKELEKRFGLATDQAIEFGAAFAAFRADKSAENLAALQEVVGGLGATLAEDANPELLALVEALSENLQKADDASDALEMFGNALNGSAEAAATLDEALEGPASKLDRLLEGLREEQQLYGASARAKALYTAVTEGATAAQVAEINALFDAMKVTQARLDAGKAATEKELADKKARDAKLEDQERALTEMFAAEDRKRIEKNKTSLDLYLANTEARVADSTSLVTSVFQQLESSMGTAFEKAIFDATSLEDAFSGLAETIGRTAVNALGQFITQYAITKLMEKTIDKQNQAGAAAMMSANAAAMVPQAALNAYTSTAAIPIVGPGLAPAAAGKAAAFAGALASTVAALSFGGAAARALGGQVRPGESYVVGERGPEVLTMGNANGRITTNESMRGAQPRLVYSPTVNISGGATEQDRALFTAQLRQQKAEIADLLARRRF